LSAAKPLPSLKKQSEKPRNPSQIRFVRSRMLYGRCTTNAQSKTRLGFRHIRRSLKGSQDSHTHKLDVLNRLDNLESKEQTIHFAKYVFPLQFGLHNVFTSTVNKKETTYQLKDYTLRETEISRDCKSFKVPKRLRGSLLHVLQTIRRNHSRLSYVQLLNHHCPSRAVADSLDQSPTTLTTHPTQVFLFIKSVLCHLINWQTLGLNNWKTLVRHLKRFLGLRKLESMSLGDVLHGIKVCNQQSGQADMTDY
jgi:telomerase reverse transcriptase